MATSRKEIKKPEPSPVIEVKPGYGDGELNAHNIPYKNFLDKVFPLAERFERVIYVEDLFDGGYPCDFAFQALCDYVNQNPDKPYTVILPHGAWTVGSKLMMKGQQKTIKALQFENRRAPLELIGRDTLLFMGKGLTYGRDEKGDSHNTSPILSYDGEASLSVRNLGLEFFPEVVHKFDNSFSQPIQIYAESKRAPHNRVISFENCRLMGFNPLMELVTSGGFKVVFDECELGGTMRYSDPSVIHFKNTKFVDNYNFIANSFDRCSFSGRGSLKNCLLDTCTIAMEEGKVMDCHIRDTDLIPGNLIRKGNTYRGSYVVHDGMYRQPIAENVALDTVISGGSSLKFSGASQPPTSGSYNEGDFIRNVLPKPGGYFGWVCVSSGKPGKWRGVKVEA